MNPTLTPVLEAPTATEDTIALHAARLAALGGYADRNAYTVGYLHSIVEALIRTSATEEGLSLLVDAQALLIAGQHANAAETDRFTYLRESAIVAGFVDPPGIDGFSPSLRGAL